jgi:hypothetical protein
MKNKVLSAIFLVFFSLGRWIQTRITDILILLIGIVVVFIIVKKLRDGYKCSLKFRVEIELEKSRWKLLKQRLVVKFTQLYLPSWFSFGFLFIIFLFLWILAHNQLPFIQSEQVKFREASHYQNLIAILSGIGTIIFALIIFIAESLRDDSEKARVLLKESWLYPLTVLGLGSLVIFSWSDVTSLSIIVIFAMALFAVFSVSRIIALLLDRPTFLKKKKSLFKDRVRNSIDYALRTRIGNNIYLKFLEDDDYNLDFSFFDVDKEWLTTIKLADVGVITDIDLCTLNQLFQKLEELANLKDRSFKLKKDAKVPNRNSLSTSGDLTETQANNKTPTEGYLLQKFGDEVSDERKDALRIPKILIEDKRDEKEITNLLRKAFVVTGKPEDSLSEMLKGELSKTKDAAIDAIHSGKTGALDEAVEVYLSVVESFLEVLKNAGGGYSQKDARKERGSIGGGWDEVRWVSEDLYNLLTEAVKTKNRDIITTISSLPLGISIRAVKFSDHFVFQEFIQFPAYLYSLSENIEDVKLRDFIIDRSWRYLKEVSDIYISSQLDKPNKSMADLENAKDYGIDVMLAFNRLLKLSFDRKDIKSFNIFKDTINQLFDRFEPSETYPQARDLRLFLQRPNLNDTEKAELEEKLKKQELLEQIEKEIHDRKHQLFYGTAAWILIKLIGHNLDNETLLSFWSSLNSTLPTDLKELTDVYQDVSNFGTESFWGWDWWDLENQPAGIATSINVNARFDWLYVVQALNLAKNLSQEQVENTEIIPKRDLVFSFEKDDSAIKQRLKEIEDDQEKWKTIVPQESFEKISFVRSLLDKVVAQQKDNEEKSLISAVISNKKFDDFFMEFKQYFYKSAGLRKLFQSKHAFKQYVKKNKNTITQLGFNQLDDKAAYIDNWHVDYGGWGRHYGEELGHAENLKIIQELSAAITPESTNKTGIGPKLIEAINKLRRRGFNKLVALTTLDPWDLSRSKLEGIEFIPKYQQTLTPNHDISSYIGHFKIGKTTIPIFEIRIREDSKNICIVDLAKFASFVQYPPDSNNEEKPFKRDIFILRVIDLNVDSNLRQKVIDKKPGWLEQYTDKHHFLKQKVVLNILEKFEIVIKSKSAAIKIDISDELVK